MRKLNVTKRQFVESKHLQRKYGKLKYVSESGRLYKTDKGNVLKFNESNDSGKDMERKFEYKGDESSEPNPLKAKLVMKAKQATEQAMNILDQAAEEVENAAG